MDVIKRRIINTILPIVYLSALIPGVTYASTAHLKGDFNVSGGQADYQLPIRVAPGRAGHSPSLKLAYSSDNPNGILGVGWQLRGLSSIYRCGKNLAFDGKWGGVNLDSNDQYCLDGQRLIPITGNAGEAGTEYRTRINDYRKIISFGKQGSGPKYFKVWSKDGQLFEYGVSDSSRAELPGKTDVYKWSLSKISDITQKNHISFDYFEDKTNGYHRIQEVTYPGGKVTFNFESRTDTQFSYLAGSKLNTKYRLKSIVSTTSGGDQVAQYNLNYQKSSGTNRSLLKEVEHCVDGVCSEPVAFTWQTQSAAKFNSGKSVFAHKVKNAKFYDLERDGLIEILSLSQNKKTVVTNSDAKKKATGWGHYYSNNQDTACHDFDIADWNGNDKPIFHSFCAGSTPGQFMAYPDGDGTYSEFYNQNVSSYGWAKKDHIPLDKNGDGKYVIESVCEGCSYYDINGDGQNNEYLKYDNGTLDYYKSGNKVQTVFSGLYPQKRILDVADINNDGYLDLLVSRYKISGNSSGDTSNTLQVFYFNGNEFKALGEELTVDYNTTLIKERYSCRGHKEHDCYRYYRYVSPNESAFVDINGDGFLDLTYADKLFINLGGTFTNNETSSIYSKLGVKDVDVRIVDVNSDGWADNFDGSSIKRSKPFAQDKIKTITEYGISYNLTYKPLTDTSVHEQVKHYNYPIVNSTPTKYVVSQYEATPQGYSPVKTTFFYRGAKSHLKGEGFLGFAQIDRIRFGVNEEKTVTKFEQDDPVIAGRVLESTTYRNNVRYLKETNKYSKKAHTGVGAKYYEVILESSTSYSYNSAGKIEKQTASSFTFDDFGNVKKKTADITSGITGGGHFTETKTYDYLSTGSITKSAVIEANSSSTASSLFAKYDNFQLWCTENGTKYIKPTDQFVLIHGEISIPLITKRYNEFYKLDVKSSTTLNGISVVTKADFVSVSESTFNSANTSLCGSYVVLDHNGDKQLDLSTANKTATQLLTETGDNYWKVSAPVSVSTDISDISLDYNRAVSTAYRYDGNGMLIEEVISPDEYESGDSNYGNTAKQIINRYRYDSYGNITWQENSGTGAASRITTTNYDSESLFPLNTSNALNQTTSFQHDARFGLVAKTVSPVKDRTTTLQYDGFGRVSKQDPHGSSDSTVYQYRLGSSCIASTSKTVSCVIANIANGKGGVYQTVTHFDYAGREIRAMHQAFDGNWVYRDTHWDKDGRKVAISRPSFTKPDSKLANVPAVRFSYDVRDREVLKTEPSASGGVAKFATSYSGLTTSVINAKGYEKTITYNVLGHIVNTVEDKDGINAFQNYVNYPDGKLKTTTDSAGNTTEIRYDNLGYRTYLDDPDMGKWLYNYNVFGELEYKKDANGVITNISYNAVGQKVSETQGNQTSSWIYDSSGLIKEFSGKDNKREFFYNKDGLVQEVKVTSKGQAFSNTYTYDGLERVESEVRPNGLKLEYLYNSYGYHAAVRSPKEFADDIFSKPSFRADIQKLINEALVQAQSYLNMAEDYAVKQTFFEDKASEYANREIDLHNLDSQSIQLLKDANRYKRYCTADGECYLQAATWVLLHDDVTVPLDVDLDQYFKIDSNPGGTKPGLSLFNSSVHQVSAQEFNSRNFNNQDEWLLNDYDRNGSLDLVGRDDVYGVAADSATRQEAAQVYSSDELSLAAQIAAARYQYYFNLADKLVALAEQVGELSGLYCDDANRLAGDNVSQRATCANDQEVSQVDHLQTVLEQSKMDDANGFVYYWQRQNTDAYNHTLSETLGNGLVNSYVHNQATGRPNAIATHWASNLVSQRNHNKKKAGQNIRYLRYFYDDHNNVSRRDDLELGISESFEYDALDRLTRATPLLDQADRHGPNNPDFNRTFSYGYDKLGNLTSKTDIGGYEYNGEGPHAVSKANGITFTYDKVGNLEKGEIGTTTKTIERSLEWSSFNKPTKITRNGHTIEFAYDANHNRYYRKDSNGSETYYFDKLYERVKDLNTGEVQHKQYIYADGKLIALNIQKRDSEDNPIDKQVRYLHYDALGSVDLITDGFGNEVERRSYDPWGKTRKIVWRTKDDSSILLQFTLTNRGYTGHEQLPEVGMIHMNGRVYDQELGRFLSADPVIQSPYRTNSFNRYSYVNNNPLKYVDPTGFTLSESCDVSTESSGGTRNDKNDNCNDNGRQEGISNRRNEENGSNQVKTSESIDSIEHEKYKNGKLVPNEEQEFDGYHDRNGNYQPGIIDANLATVTLVEQSLNVNMEVHANQPHHNVELTDLASELVQAGALATTGIVGQTLVNGATALVKGSQTVKVDIVTTNTLTYDVYNQPAKHFTATKETHLTGEKVKTGKRVSYTYEVGRVTQERNIRDVGSMPSMPNAPISPPSKYQGILSR